MAGIPLGGVAGAAARYLVRRRWARPGHMAGPCLGCWGGWSGGDVACFQLRGAGHWLPGLVLGVVGSGGTAAVTYHTAVAVAIAYVAAATLAGAVTFSRRDVTA